MAVVAGVESAVQIHIARGDDLNARDDKGFTPLMLSAARNKAAICKLLIEAGADAGLLDLSGRDALGIAQAAGALEAALVIEATRMAEAVSSDVDGSRDLTSTSLNVRMTEASSEQPAIQLVASAPPAPDTQSDFDQEIENGSAPTPPIEWASDVPAGSDAFDLTGWEAEEDQPPPEDDPALTVAAVEIQGAISEHQPIDTSVDWEDFAVFLPERASPLPRADDAEARQRLRLVLLRAIREGSVPHSSIEDITLDEDGSPNEEAGSLLRMVINDLGAETDERFEYSSPDESFEVFVAPEEEPDEEDTLADALAFVDDLAARRNEPLRIYQREFQREALLTADAEVALGQAMERGVERALDALASWPSGICAVMDAAKMVTAGAKPLRWMSCGPRVEPQDIEFPPNIESIAESAPLTEAIGEGDESDSQFGFDATASIDELSEFSTNAELLSDLAVSASHDTPEWSACRSALASLGLTRGFLMELVNFGLADQTEPAIAFTQAITAYRRARDQMAVANLKLVFSIAKKYIFSGEPLDDLLQEGNIGLIKAVDRYDWRKGFKFSTYATWWIRQQVGRHVADKSKTIRLPVHVYVKTQRIAQAANAFELKKGRTPTVDELAVLVDLPTRKTLSLALAALEPLPVHEIDALDDSIAMDAKDEFTARDPMNIVEDQQLIDCVDRFLGTLKLKEERVLRMRFGIGIQDSMTLEEIGARLDVTRERVRQIETKAIQTLRHPARLGLLSRKLNSTPPPTRIEEVAEPNEPHEEADSSPSTAPALPSANLPSQLDASEHPSARPDRASGSEPSIDKLLDQAREAGVAIDDDREAKSARIWVYITNAPDSRSRKLVRGLIDLGFEFWPGKGYWR
jgi:RNA polymerase primary sigma factor